MQHLLHSHRYVSKLVRALAITLLVPGLMIVVLSCSLSEGESYHVLEDDHVDPLLLPWHFVIQSKITDLSSQGDPLRSKIAHSLGCPGSEPAYYHIQYNWKPDDTLTAIVFYADFEERSAISHFNVKTDQVWSDYPLDLDRDGQCEVAFV